MLKAEYKVYLVAMNLHKTVWYL